MESVRYRWVDGRDATDEDWDKIEGILAARGWASLNRNGARILIAEQNGEEAFMIFQQVPYVGPLLVPTSMRGGEVAREMSKMMFKFMEEVQIRGWLVTAESPFAAKLCELFNMKLVEQPVYVMPYFGGVEI